MRTQRTEFYVREMAEHTAERWRSRCPQEIKGELARPNLSDHHHTILSNSNYSLKKYIFVCFTRNAKVTGGGDLSNNIEGPGIVFDFPLPFSPWRKVSLSANVAQICGS